MQNLLLDVRYALRVLRNSPAFAIVALLHIPRLTIFGAATLPSAGWPRFMRILMRLCTGVTPSKMSPARIVYQANPNHPAVVGGAVLIMALLGIAASAIPAGRALAIHASSLMREE